MAADLTGEVCERGRVVGTKERERENEENISISCTIVCVRE